MMEDKYNQYDQVVNVVMLNVMAEKNRCGKFLLYDFNPEEEADKLYYNVSAIAADLSLNNLYLHMPFFKYLKFKFKSGRKNLRYFNFFQELKLKPEHKTSVFMLMDYIREELNLPQEIFGEINNEYYKQYN